MPNEYDNNSSNSPPEIIVFPCTKLIVFRHPFSELRIETLQKRMSAFRYHYFRSKNKLFATIGHPRALFCWQLDRVVQDVFSCESLLPIGTLNEDTYL